MYESENVWIRECIYVKACIGVYVYVYIYMYMYVYMGICMCVWVCMFICKWVYVHVSASRIYTIHVPVYV